MSTDSSSLTTLFEELQLLDYMIVAATTAVCYDYLLIFSREVELIWMKPWSVMSTLFVVARYLGLLVALVSGLGSGFALFYMSELMYVCAAISYQTLVKYIPIGGILPRFTTWTKLIYTIVADVIMIIRVSVMFNKPKRTRWILFFLYTLVTINTIVFTFIWEGPRSGLSITAIPLNPFIDGTICEPQYGHNEVDFIYDGIPRGVFDILLLVLAIYRFTVHVIETRRALGRQKINKYMTLLLEHSLLYFILNFAYEALAAGTINPSAPNLYVQIVPLYVNSIPFIMYPRLVLSMRDSRETSGGLHVGSEGSGHARLLGHSKSPSVPVTESTDYDAQEGTSSKLSHHTRGYSY